MWAALIYLNISVDSAAARSQIKKPVYNACFHKISSFLAVLNNLNILIIEIINYFMDHQVSPIASDLNCFNINREYERDQNSELSPTNSYIVQSNVWYSAFDVALYALMAKISGIKQISNHMSKMCGNEVFLCREILFLYSLGGASARENTLWQLNPFKII